jgi:hypothetical protein
MKVSTKSKKINAYMESNPDAKASVIAKKFGVTVASIYQRKSKLKSAAPKGNWKLASVSTSKKSVFQKPSTLAPNAVMSMALHTDMVNHPPHYKAGGIETIDFIEAKNLGYNLGNVVKYVSRADLKGNKVEDLQKARWYLDRAIANLSKT